MTKQTRPVLKGYFETGDVPTAAQFADLIDSFPVFSEYDSHTHDITDVSGLSAALDGKSDAGHTHTAAQVSGLGSAATTDASAYASAAQGATADSAVQPGDLVATEAGNILTGQPKFWVGSQADYDAIATPDPNTIYDVVS